MDGGVWIRNTGSMSKKLFFAGIIVTASGITSPPVALALGLIFGFSFVHPYHVESKSLSKFLLQASVEGLGFGMNLQQRWLLSVRGGFTCESDVLVARAHFDEESFGVGKFGSMCVKNAGFGEMLAAFIAIDAAFKANR